MTSATQDPQELARKRARQWFKDQGIAVAQWAKEHKFNRQNVVDVLHGRSKCTRGEAHKIAVALGIKPEPKPITLRRAA